MSAHRYAQKAQQSELPARADHLAFASNAVRHEPSIASGADRSKGNAVVNGTENDGKPVSVDLATAITSALDRCGISQKEAALTMGLTPGQWSKQLNGYEGHHVSLPRLLQLGPEFLREFLPFLNEPAGLASTRNDLADLTLLKVSALMQEVAQLVVALKAQRRVA